MLFTNATTLTLQLFEEDEDGTPVRATVGDGEGAPASLASGKTLEIPQDVRRLEFDIREHGTPKLVLRRSTSESINAIPFGDPTLTDPDILRGGSRSAEAIGDPTLTDPDIRGR